MKVGRELIWTAVRFKHHFQPQRTQSDDITSHRGLRTPKAAHADCQLYYLSLNSDGRYDYCMLHLIHTSGRTEASYLLCWKYLMLRKLKRLKVHIEGVGMYMCTWRDFFGEIAVQELSLGDEWGEGGWSTPDRGLLCFCISWKSLTTPPPSTPPSPCMRVCVC